MTTKSKLPPLVGIMEIVEMTGYSRVYVDQLRHRKQLPEPDAVVSTRPVWMRETIEAWMDEWSKR